MTPIITTNRFRYNKANNCLEALVSYLSATGSIQEEDDFLIMEQINPSIVIVNPAKRTSFTFRFSKCITSASGQRQYIYVPVQQCSATRGLTVRLWGSTVKREVVECTEQELVSAI